MKTTNCDWQLRPCSRGVFIFDLKHIEKENDSKYMDEFTKYWVTKRKKQGRKRHTTLTNNLNPGKVQMKEPENYLRIIFYYIAGRLR